MKCFLFVLLLLSFSASADTIYHCKDYGGGTFWANTTCGNHKALIDRIATVPGGMSFDQQVRIAEGQRKALSKEIAVQEQQDSINTTCGQLKAERDKIWSRYANWQYQAPEVVGPDRQRTLAIQAQQQRLGCSMQ